MGFPFSLENFLIMLILYCNSREMDEYEKDVICLEVQRSFYIFHFESIAFPIVENHFYDIGSWFSKENKVVRVRVVY